MIGITGAVTSSRIPLATSLGNTKTTTNSGTSMLRATCGR
jgi:hypothetical protein